VNRVASALRDWPRPALLAPLSAVLLVAGCCAGFLLPQLPSSALLWPVAVTCMLLVLAIPASRVLLLPLLGACWMLLQAHVGLQARLPHALEGEDLPLAIRVVGLPERNERQQRFEARVLDAPAEAATLIGARLRLSRFGSEDLDLQPGEHWQVVARLKRPRGTLNAGGFDYERFALEQGIAATGYLRDSATTRKLREAGGVDLLRLRLSEDLAATLDMPASRFLRGLAVGDRRGLDGADWERLRATGLSHLLAISGLHIGLLAGFGVLLGRAFYRLWPRLGLHLPRPQGMALAAIPFAAGYAALAGFGLPVQRSLLMIGCVLLALLWRRALLPAQGLALAAVAIVVVDPLALLGASFWLSFLGVAWLLLCLPAASSAGGVGRSLLMAQGVLSLGLLPLTVWFFGQASLSGALANLLAVPLVSLVVVPLTLLGTLLLPWPLLAKPLLVLAGLAMEGLWRVAGWLEDVPGSQLFLPEPSLLAVLLAVLAAGWLLLPRGVPGKPLAVLLLLPLLVPTLPRMAHGELAVDVIDVGQGLAVLLRTRDHAMLYDSGPAFAGGLDLGEAAVVPALRATGVDRLDLLLLSHGDNDHAGGAGAVKRALQPHQLLTGEPRRLAEGTHCAGMGAWEWDGVTFAILHPPAEFPELGNESSCVLSVRAAGAHVLLPGDIGRPIETRLLREHGAQLSADVLLVPHHGSDGSSSAELVAAVAPRLALVASGHRNRFGHPRPEVLARYRAQGSQIENTVDAGAISLRLQSNGQIELLRRRQTHQRFWHESAAGPMPPQPAR
jgi:competence protein ComEC